jgi:hypothetical protein
VWAALCRREPAALPALLRAALRPRLPAGTARRAGRLLSLALAPGATSPAPPGAGPGSGAASRARAGGAPGTGRDGDTRAAPVVGPELDLSCFGLPVGGTPGESTPLEALEATPFAHFVAACALGWPDAAARRAAAAAALAARGWLTGLAQRQADALLLAWAPRLAGYGAAAGELLSGLAYAAAPRGLGDAGAAGEGSVALLHALQAALAALAEHPHAAAYRALRSVLDMGDSSAAAARPGGSHAGTLPHADGGAPATAPDSSGGGGDGGSPYCLALAAEDVALAPAAEHASRLLDSVAASLRYTGAGVMARLSGWQSVAGFAVGVGNPSSVACVAHVAFYYCTEPVGELQQVRGPGR